MKHGSKFFPDCEESNPAAAQNEMGIFAIRGSLDGEHEAEYTEKIQYIGLQIRSELFFVPIAIVAEIVMLTPITYVPRSRRHIEGVMNLRGTILPVINLRRLMEQQRGTATPATRIIIIKMDGVLLGLLVDAITYVVSLHPSDFEPNTVSMRGPGSDFIAGIAKDGDRVIGVLDCAKIIQAVSEGSVAVSGVEAGANAPDFDFR